MECKDSTVGIRLLEFTLVHFRSTGQVKLVVETWPHSSEKQEPGKHYKTSSAHHRMLLMLSSPAPTFCNIPSALTNIWPHHAAISCSGVKLALFRHWWLLALHEL